MVIAVVDDTLQDRTIMETMLNRYFRERGMDLRTDTFSSAEEFLRFYGPGRYDVIFFDIYMGGMNGMEAARQVCRIDADCRLIFFTSSTDYAVDSYKVKAAYYLMKPLEYGELCRALDRICGKPEHGRRELSVALREGLEAGIPFKKILYVDCVRRIPQIHTADSVMAAASSFSALEEQLEKDRRFLCCNRSLYVNMEWIREVEEQNVVMKNGERLPIRVRGRGQVKKEYLRYVLRELRENNETI